MLQARRRRILPGCSTSARLPSADCRLPALSCPPWSACEKEAGSAYHLSRSRHCSPVALTFLGHRSGDARQGVPTRARPVSAPFAFLPRSPQAKLSRFDASFQNSKRRTISHHELNSFATHSPQELAVKADIPNRQVRAMNGLMHCNKRGVWLAIQSPRRRRQAGYAAA